MWPIGRPSNEIGRRLTHGDIPGKLDTPGASPTTGGVNFAVTASDAERVDLCLFDTEGGETRLALPESDGGIWHGFVPGIGPGQAYGYRVIGAYDPDHGLWSNPGKLLVDPYARAIAGDVTFGPEVLSYRAGDVSQPSDLDSAAHVPRKSGRRFFLPMAPSPPQPPLRRHRLL